MSLVTKHAGTLFLVLGSLFFQEYWFRYSTLVDSFAPLGAMTKLLPRAPGLQPPTAPVGLKQFTPSPLVTPPGPKSETGPTLTPAPLLVPTGAVPQPEVVDCGTLLGAYGAVPQPELVDCGTPLGVYGAVPQP